MLEATKNKKINVQKKNVMLFKTHKWHVIGRIRQKIKIKQKSLNIPKSQSFMQNKTKENIHSDNHKRKRRNIRVILHNQSCKTTQNKINNKNLVHRIRYSAESASMSGSCCDIYSTYFFDGQCLWLLVFWRGVGRSRGTTSNCRCEFLFFLLLGNPS